MRIIIFGFILISIGCKNDVPPFDAKTIEGRWMITEAMRKNRQTQTLDGAILSISQTQLTHNFYGTDTTLDITWGSNYMLADTNKYIIEAHLDSLLILKVNLQKFPFRITCKRLNDNQTEE